jgi:hypothetical protein
VSFLLLPALQKPPARRANPESRHEERGAFCAQKRGSQGVAPELPHRRPSSRPGTPFLIDMPSYQLGHHSRGWRNFRNFPGNILRD